MPYKLKSKEVSQQQQPNDPKTMKEIISINNNFQNLCRHRQDLMYGRGVGEIHFRKIGHFIAKCLNTVKTSVNYFVLEKTVCI